MINDCINIGLEVGLRKIFIDYLDDVSGVYVFFDVLCSNNGELVVVLGNRIGEFLGIEFVDMEEGVLCGNLNWDDWYMMGGFIIIYMIFSDRGGSSKVGCCCGGK